MKFIKKDVPKKDTRVGYLLVIDTMVGDANGWEIVEVGTFNESELHLLEEVVSVCDRMIDAYPHGRGGDDDYNHVEGFERWFSEDYDGSCEDIEHLAPFSWSYDPSWYCQNSIEGYKVIYLDSGDEYEVEIIK